MSDIVPIRVALSVPVRVFVRVLIRVRVSVRFPVCPSFATPSMCCVVHVPVPWAPASACFITRSCANPNMCRAWPTERVSVRVLVHLPERVFSLWSGTCSSASFCACRRKYFSVCSLACSIARSYTGSIIERNGAKNVQERKLEKDER